MKLIAEIAGERLQCEVEREGARVIAVIEGQRYELAAREPEAGVYLLVGEGRVYECRVNAAERDGNAGGSVTREVRIGDGAYGIVLADPKRLRGSRRAGAGGADVRAEVLAPMPGKVVRLLVEAGARVEAGDGLVIVEAMKMQNEMKSPKAGIVVEVKAQTGATVNAGDCLVVVE